MQGSGVEQVGRGRADARAELPCEVARRTGAHHVVARVNVGPGPACQLPQKVLPLAASRDVAGVQVQTRIRAEQPAQLREVRAVLGQVFDSPGVVRSDRQMSVTAVCDQGEMTDRRPAM